MVRADQLWAGSCGTTNQNGVLMMLSPRIKKSNTPVEFLPQTKQKSNSKIFFRLSCSLVSRPSLTPLCDSLSPWTQDDYSRARDYCKTRLSRERRGGAICSGDRAAGWRKSWLIGAIGLVKGQTESNWRHRSTTQQAFVCRLMLS